MTLDGDYIRMIGGTEAPHWLPHFIPDNLLFKRWNIKHISMVFMLHFLKKRRVLGLLFPFTLECARLKISNKKKMK